MRTVWAVGETGASESWDVDALARRVRAAAEATERGARPAAPLVRPLPFPTQVTVRTRAWATSRLTVAAVALVAAGGLALLGSRVNRGGDPVAREYAAARGRRATIRLADGTSAVLAPGSTLRTLAGFGGQSRDVALDGEAYFVVVHDRRRPFAVHAGYAVARDLGTHFDVRAFAGDTAVQVAVTEGRVAFGDTVRSPVELRAGDVSQLTGAGNAVVLRHAAVGRYVAWTQGVLAFDNTPLREVAPALSRWYDLQVDIADTSIAGRRLTASFTQTPPLAVVLEAIARSLDVRVDRDGRVVVFRPLARRVSTPLPQHMVDARAVSHPGAHE
jgi:transmembrane sensor